MGIERECGEAEEERRFDYKTNAIVRVVAR